jgi:ABC-type transport system involved in multi-copper enzyme maturation permease subunit
MNWLIWKEYRNNRVIFGAGLALLLLPHAIALFAGLRHPDLWTESFQPATVASIVITSILLALLGGNAIAGERADRSAEFLACLPISRRRHLASKLILAPLWLVVILGFNLAIVLFASGSDIRPGEFIADILQDSERWEFLLGVGCYVGTIAAFFCVGWFWSSLLSSPTLASAFGLIAPPVIIGGINGVIWLTGVQFSLNEEVVIACWYAGVTLTLSMACFVAGSWYYLRRVEP